MDMVFAVIGLFVLRLGVPLALMVLLSWVVSRYVQRQEAEEFLMDGELASAEEPQPETTAFVIPAKDAPSACWDIKGCSADERADCPAALRPGLPCWLAKQLVTGSLSPNCEQCAVYQQSLVALSAAVDRAA